MRQQVIFVASRCVDSAARMDSTKSKGASSTPSRLRSPSSTELASSLRTSRSTTWVRLVFDWHLVVHEVHPFTDSAPYPVCHGGGAALQAIRGLKMSSGWKQ